MIYLFGSGAWENSRRIVKIGFTDNMEKRKTNYFHYNPLGKIIDTRDGDELDELRLHLRLYDHKVEFLDEWFYDEDEVFRVFKEDSYNDIDKWLWEHRTEILVYPQIPSPGSKKRKLLDYIRNNLGKTNLTEGQKL